MPWGGSNGQLKIGVENHSSFLFRSLPSLLRYALTRFFRPCAFIAAHIDGRNRIDVSPSLDHLHIAICWRFHEIRVQLLRHATWFMPIDVVARYIRVRHRSPDQVDKRLLTWP